MKIEIEIESEWHNRRVTSRIIIGPKLVAAWISDRAKALANLSFPHVSMRAFVSDGGFSASLDAARVSSAAQKPSNRSHTTCA
jgi:hypothetical protein